MMNTATDNWMRNHPGQTMTVHYIPGIVRAFSLAFTDKNAIAGFTCTGMSPFNRSIFTEVDYAPSPVTDRPLQDNNEIQQSAIEDDRTIGTDGLPEPGPSLRAIQTEAKQLLSAGTSDPSPKSPQPGPSGLQATSTQLISFLPELVQDPKQKESSKHRNKAKKTIFQPHTGRGKGTLLTAKGKDKGKKTKNPPGSKGNENQSEANSNSSDDEDYYCLVCLESFRNSASNETWVQCGDCRNWSHAACIKDNPYHVCHNCESE
ncbi:hypothetical protein JTB14_013468 [Gonioctena quinquepunctata]|nr:hypothetical protein JTB14_013468 [Gonioctena quinquepunctata]